MNSESINNNINKHEREFNTLEIIQLTLLKEILTQLEKLNETMRLK